MRCVVLLPEVFEEDDEGHSYAPDSDVPAEFEARARQAAHACPEQAIIVTE
jgi:ferredoxin